MATCPNCGSHLTTNHRCRRTLRREIVEGLVAIVAGAGAAILATVFFDQSGQLAAFDGLTLLLGGALGFGLHWGLRRRL